MKRTNFQQFFVEPNHVNNERFFLVKDEAKHASLVLRKNIGDVIDAVDGNGNWFSGKIIKIDKHEIECEILKRDINVGEPQLKLVLYHSVPKGNLFDLVVEKGVEIGVSIFQPILTERSQFNPENKVDRWNAKALAAMKQCGRSKIPQVLPPIKFAQALKNCENELSFFAHEACKGNEYDWSKLKNVYKVNLFIGPEGGFTDQEFEAAVSKGMVAFSLGKRRLRSETAALVGAAKIFTYSGELD